MASSTKKKSTKPARRAKPRTGKSAARRKPATRVEAKSTAKNPPTAPPEELLGYYRDLLLIRRFEEKAGQMYGTGLIGGFCHLYIGQEAIAVGIKAARKPSDALITSYRDHGHILASGAEPGAVMAELTGRIGGVSKGKGGSVHMFARDKNFFGGHGIVGAQVPIGTGIALAQKTRGDGGVTIACFGEGAANQGQVHEAFNMASLWKLPVIYVIENNRYAMGTAIERSSAAHERMYLLGEGVGIPGERVYGMDIEGVKAAIEKAAEHCRAGKGPFVLEIRTYRYRGHSMSDPAQYRSKDEVADIRRDHDPITLLYDRILKAKYADEDTLKQIDRDVRAVVAEAAQFAETSPEPDPSELYTDVVLGA